MNASPASPASPASSVELNARQQRIVDALRPFFGAEADALYEANGRSLQKLAYSARQSALPSFRRLATGLALAQELLCEELTTRSVFDTPTAVADFLKLHFAGQPYESFVVLFLDSRSSLIAFEEMFRGTLSQTSVYPREVLKRVLHHDAAAILVAHNHPTGCTEPSPADKALTRVLRDALNLIDVQLLDHWIVAGGQTLSFVQRGLL
ncbi:RadC family protein [Variovorax rhizosphaerae]|uniref:DNA repair protein RadC n=1 Tax=Variovorax rhizosphaerae TaxID=1836200 RepID=A0ABU8X0B3_9BURK